VLDAGLTVSSLPRHTSHGSAKSGQEQPTRSQGLRSSPYRPHIVIVVCVCVVLDFVDAEYGTSQLAAGWAVNPTNRRPVHVSRFVFLG